MTRERDTTGDGKTHYYPAQHELTTPAKLERALRLIIDTQRSTAARLQQQLDSGGSVGAPTNPATTPPAPATQTIIQPTQIVVGNIDAQLSVIRDALQDEGSTELNVGGLDGILRQPQRALVPTITLPPPTTTAIEGQLQYYDYKLLRFTKGDPQLYVGVAGSDYKRRRASVTVIPSTATEYAVGPAVTVTVSGAHTSGEDGYRMATGAVIGNWSGWNAASGDWWASPPNERSDEVTLHCHLRLDSVTTFSSVRYWVGFFSGNPNASDAPAVRHAAFRLSTSAGDTSWKCITSNGGAQTIKDSGVVVPTTYAGARYQLEIHWHEYRVDFYINNSFVGSSAATLPANVCSWYATVTTLAAAARAIEPESLVVEW